MTISYPSEGDFASESVLSQPGQTRMARQARRRTRHLVMAAVVVLVVVVAAWWVTNSALFDLRSLTVAGNSHLSDRRIEALADLRSGTNVFWLSPGRLADRIERNPWVRSAGVSRTLPGGVAIVIAERTPVAVAAGRSLLVAGDGTVLGRTGRNGGLPSIPVVSGPLRPGSRIPSRLPVLVVARALPPALRGFVAVISTGADGLTLTLRDGVEVSFGGATDLAAKTSALQAVLSWTGRHGIRARAIDVRIPDAPALTPAPGSPLP